MNSMKYLCLLYIIVSIYMITGNESKGISCCDENCHLHEKDTTALKLHDDRCYQFVHREVYWPDANKYCRMRGGRLVTIENDQKMAFIKQTVNSLTWRNDGIWIGLNDRNKEGHWEWTTEDEGVVENMEYSNWAKGHPTGFLRLESLRDCVRMKRENGAWKWHDTPCSAIKWHYRFICQYDFIPPTTTERYASHRSIVGLPRQGALNDQKYFSTSTTADPTDVITTDSNSFFLEKEPQVQASLQQSEMHHSKLNAILAIAILCGITFVIVIILLLVVIFKKRNVTKAILSNSVKNPMYEYGMNGANSGVVINECAGDGTKNSGDRNIHENEYVMNIHENPLDGAGSHIAIDAGYEEPIKSRYEVPVNSTTHPEMLKGSDGYLPMDACKLKPNSKVGVALPELPGQSRYDVPRATKVEYSEIAEDGNPVYEYLD